nr:hypothetical protein [Nitrosopumilus sp.]
MNPSNKKFVYFSRSIEDDDDHGKKENNGAGKQQKQLTINDLNNKIKNNNNELLKHFFPDILKALGNKAIKENTPSLQELEQYLQTHIQELVAEERMRMMRKRKANQDSNSSKTVPSENKIKHNIQRQEGNSNADNPNNLSSASQPSSTTQQGNFRLNFNFNNTSS